HLRGCTSTAAVAGLAGALFVTLNGFVTPSTAGLSAGLILFIGVLLGGTATVIGPVLGIGLVATIQHYLEVAAPNFQQFIFGLVLLAAMMLVPAGIVGTWRRSRLGNIEDPEPESERLDLPGETPAQAPGAGLSMQG